MSRLDEIAEHLESCRDCQTSLDQLAGQSDALLLELRGIPQAARADAALSREMAAMESSAAAFLGDTCEIRSSADTQTHTPQRLGEYVILDALGRGGMGTVWRARHARLDKLVAIKLLPPHRLGDAAAAARFQREMRAVGKLSHPNIVAATDAGEFEGQAFLVMEFVDGADLAQLIQQRGRLAVAEACELVRQAAVALEYAHAHGLVHRDIKPSNLLLSLATDQPAGGLVKLADLGLALLPDVESDLASNATSANLMIGSLDYMAPEQADDAHHVDHRADLYGLGCTMYELLSGRPPYAAPIYRTRLQKMNAHADAPVPALRDAYPEVPPELEQIVQRLLAKSPDDRFATAAELAAALAPFAAGAKLASLFDEGAPRLATKTDTPSRNPVAPAARQRYSPPVPAHPVSPRTKGIVLGVATLAAVASIIYVQTDRGTLEIKSDDEEVKVRVEQEGRLVTLVDLKSNKEIRLRSGTYEVALGDAEQDLALDADEFTLHRGGKEVLHIRRQPPTLLRLPFDAAEAKRHQERWARFRGVPQTVKNDLDMALTLIPPGEFEMRPGYRVKITKPYYLGTYEVTVAQFRKFAEATGYKSLLEGDGRGTVDLGSFKEVPGMNWRNPELARGDDHPVAGVNWYDAEQFCKWLSDQGKQKYRLPTDAEWEWAARSGSAAAYAWGDDDQRTGDYEWYNGNSDWHSHAVGEKPANVWGLHDMGGNIVEWCGDWHLDSFPQAEVSDPSGPPLAGGARVLRGGGYIDNPMPCSNRGCFSPSISMIHCGFRICREL